MPASVTGSTIQDVMEFYLENYMANTWADAARPYQQYTTADELFTKRRKKGTISEKCTFNLKVRSADNTVPDSFFKADSLNRSDLGDKGSVNWHFQKTHFMADAREPALNSGSAVQILDYMKMQESDMYDGFFEKNEEYFWTLPASPNNGSNGDPLPFGVPYWLVSDTTEEFGFNGGLPGSYSDVAGLDPTEHTKWKNGTFAWNSVSNDDFCRKLSEAMDKCHFRPGKPMGEKVPNLNWGLYSTYKPYQEYQDLLYGLNENIGPDAGKYRGGRPTNDIGVQYFRGVPWTWVPATTEVGGVARDLNESIYGINWDTFNVQTYGDWFMKRHTPIRLDDAHNTVVQWMDTGYQIYCDNRRSNFVGRQVTASST